MFENLDSDILKKDEVDGQTENRGLSTLSNSTITVQGECVPGYFGILAGNVRYVSQKLCDTSN